MQRSATFPPRGSFERQLRAGRWVTHCSRRCRSCKWLLCDTAMLQSCLRSSARPFCPQESVYLSLEGVVVHATQDSQEERNAASPAGNGASIAAANGDGDEAALSPPRQPPDALFLDASIAYHPSYEVPVLYFRARRPCGRLLALWDEVATALPSIARAAAGQASTDTFVTQEDHILHRTPWHLIHPCQTPTRMALMTGAGDGDIGGLAAASPQPLSGIAALRYLVAWFSIVAPVVGLPAAILPANNGMA